MRFLALARRPARARRGSTLRPLGLTALLAGLAGGGGCRASPPPAAGFPGALCASRLGPALAEPASGVPPLEVPASRIIVEVEVDTPALLAELERGVPRQVAARRDLPVGAAGRLSFRIDRAPFSVGVEGEELFVDVELAGQAEICKPLGPLGCVPYASCQPRAHARASVRLDLDPGYRIPPSRVSIPITRRCTLTALDIDVTGEVQAEANRRAADLRERIDRSIPELGPLAAGLWRALGTTVPLGMGTCVRVRPTALLQSGARARAGVLSVGLGIEGELSVESPCGAPSGSLPLPAPRLDRALAPGVALHVPLVLSWDEVSRALARSVALAEPRAGEEVVHITDVRAAPASGGEISIELTVAGRVCGPLLLVGRPVPSGEGIALEGLRAPPLEASRVAREAPGLSLPALAASLGSWLRVPLPLEIASLPRRIDQVASLLIGAGKSAAAAPLDPELALRMTSARLAQVRVNQEGLSALVEAEGTATVRLHALARPPGP